MNIDKENTGMLFSNQKQNERQPEVVGYLNYNGQQIKLAAWKKTSDKGTVYFSCSLEENKEENKPQDL